MRYLKRTPKTKSLFCHKVPIIICDDREKKPFKSNFYKIERKRLKTGDYTFKGFEDILCIERKDSLKEVFTNLSGKNRKTFYEELSRLSSFPINVIIIEDEIKNTKKALNEMKKFMPDMRMSNETIWYWVNKTMFYYDIPILFVGKLFRRNIKEFDIFLSYILEMIRNI